MSNIIVHIECATNLEARNFFGVCDKTWRKNLTFLVFSSSYRFDSDESDYQEQKQHSPHPVKAPSSGETNIKKLHIKC